MRFTPAVCSKEPRDMRRLTGLMVITALMTCSGICFAQPKVDFGPLTELRTDVGRLSFGTIVSADVVSWSAPMRKTS